jgi:hypothetical protein
MHFAMTIRAKEMVAKLLYDWSGKEKLRSYIRDKI